MRYVLGGNDLIGRFTHIILDEIHERDLATDVLLYIAKRFTVRTPDLKIILMSATMNVELYRTYFHDCSVISIEGRKFDVNIKYLNDVSKMTKTVMFQNDSLRVEHDHIVLLIQHIANTTSLDEGILVFLPGLDDIVRINHILKEKNLGVRIFMLHSEIGSESNQDLFRMLPGFRKVILATNLAETSITVPDVVHIIDSGYMKILSYDASNDTTQVMTIEISRANALQRAGRAGRTMNGICYRMYSQDTFERLNNNTIPEISRTPLANTCLNLIWIIGQPIESFRNQLIEPPPEQNVRSSIDFLKAIGALSGDEQLTPFGQFALSLPFDVKYAKAVVYSIMLRCFERVVFTICMLSSKSIFKVAVNVDDKIRMNNGKQRLADGISCDFGFLYRTYYQFINRFEKQDFCREHHLSYSVMQSAKDLFTIVKDRLMHKKYSLCMTNLNYGRVNVNEKKENLVRFCLAATLFPKIGIVQADDLDSCQLSDGTSVALDRSSIVKGEPNNFIIFDKRIQTNAGRSFIKHLSKITPLMALLIIDHPAFNESNRTITVNGLVEYQVHDDATWTQIIKLRKFINDSFQKVIKHPSTFNMTHELGRELGTMLNSLIGKY